MLTICCLLGWPKGLVASKLLSLSIALKTNDFKKISIFIELYIHLVSETTTETKRNTKTIHVLLRLKNIANGFEIKMS